jgi:hypothetical protein
LSSNGHIPCAKLAVSSLSCVRVRFLVSLSAVGSQILPRLVFLSAGAAVSPAAVQYLLFTVFTAMKGISIIQFSHRFLLPKVKTLSSSFFTLSEFDDGSGGMGPAAATSTLVPDGRHARIITVVYLNEIL